MPSAEPLPFFLRPLTPEYAHLRHYTEQLVAGVMDPDLNLRMPSH